MFYKYILYNSVKNDLTYRPIGKSHDQHMLKNNFIIEYFKDKKLTYKDIQHYVH